MLTPKAKAAYHYFIKIRKNYSDISEEDYKNFYEFIRVCQETRNRISDSDVYYLLIESKITENEARELSTTFYHIRKYIKGYFKHFYEYGEDYKKYLYKNNIK